MTREQFNEVCEAIWTEIEYQNNLPRRTEDSEAKDVQGYATLTRVYLRKLEEAWADNMGDEAALPFLRKLAAINARGMGHCGIRHRVL
jgi:hypothetical protein